MSTLPLSNIQERVERSMFESIRKELFDKGYLPDIADTISYPATPTGQLNWETAMGLIRTNAGFVIELFNYSSSQAKGTKKVPRIVIISKDFIPGTLGGDSLPVYTLNPDTNAYDKAIRPPQTVDFHANIHIIGNTVNQIRIMHAIIAISLPRRGYIPFYDDPSQVFFVRNTGFIDLPQNEEGILEKVYTYEIPDLFETECPSLGTVVPIQEINLNVQIDSLLPNPIIVTPSGITFGPNPELPDNTVAVTAGENISAFRAVMIVNNKLYHYDPSDTNNYNKCIGISKIAVIAGDIGLAIIHGELQTALTIIDGATYFSLPAGVLTTTPPTSGIYQQLAVGTSTNRIFIDLKQPIILT